MNLKHALFPAIFSSALLFGMTAGADSANNGGVIAGKAAGLVASSTAASPFKGDCAANTKARFSAFLNNNGGISCGFPGKIGQSKNLEDFTTPFTGVYCFKPSKAAGISKSDVFKRVMPTVTIDWYTSSGLQLVAYPVQPYNTNDCPDGYLEVRTYDFSSGSAVATNNVSFYVMVN